MITLASQVKFHMKVALESLEDRAIEWFSAIVMLIWGVTLAMPGDLFEMQLFSSFRLFGAPEEFWMVLFLTFGSVRLTVLFINGRSPKTPYFRVGCAIFGFAVFAAMAQALAYPLLEILRARGLHADVIQVVFATQTRIGPAWAVYGTLSIFEWFSIYRASKDTRYGKIGKISVIL